MAATGAASRPGGAGSAVAGRPAGPPSGNGGAVPLRDPAVVCAPGRLGAVRPTRHSFTASLLRRAASRGWRVTRSLWQLDAQGRGEACYDVAAEGHQFRFLVFSQVIGAGERTDRVVASRWDVTAALIDGPLDEDRRRHIREQVARQEGGRADPATLVWTRGNRSGRFFDYVAGQLAAGRQPRAADLGSSPYVLRSTAYYANGKFGMAPFGALAARGPLAVPYRAQMLAAWLFREFSCELVDHIAAARSPRAVPLSPAWRRHLGIGNATGLGMVPFVINHPAIFDAWCRARELPLAAARRTSRQAARARADTLQQTLRTAATYFRQRAGVDCHPFQDGPSLAGELLLAADQAARLAGRARPWDTLWRWAGERLGLEAREVLASCLVDLDPGLDAAAEAMLTVPEPGSGTGPQSAGELRAAVEQ
ncbi:MAG: hypothetical protein ACRDMI_18490, partial [Streptosporangiaceae bacterium]